MSRSDATVIWTCDRCGVQREIRYGEQPTDWMRVYICVPPMRAVDEAQIKWDLCHDCDSAIAKWKRQETR